MKTKIKLKVRGNYKLVTDWMRTKQIYTKQDVIDFYMEVVGKDYKAACGSAIIMLSPRLVSKHGDLRGSASNPWGHIAYNEKLPRRCINTITGQFEKQRYKFSFRDTILDKKRHTYYRRKTEQEKTSTKVKRTKVKRTARRIQTLELT